MDKDADNPSMPTLNSAPVVAPTPATPQASVTTPAPVATSTVGAEYAGILSRWLAAILDSVILALVNAPIAILFFVLGATAGQDNPMVALSSGLIQLIIEVAIAYYYFGTYQHNKGQTLGKHVMSIKTVLVADGQTPSTGKFLMRETVFKWISAITIIGYPMAIFDSKKQALHDKLAGTVVIKV